MRCGRFIRGGAVASVLVLTVGMAAACGPAASIKHTCDPTDRDRWAIAYTKQKHSYVKGVYWLLNGKPHPIDNDRVIQASQPSLSPDSRRVFFEGFYGKGGKYANKMVLAHTDGTHLKVFGEGISTPVWSPDGSRVAFRDTDPDSDTDAIYVSDPDGAHKRRIASDANTNPAWSTDGTRLAWSSARDGRMHWKSVDGGASGSVEIARDDVLAQAWLPDGKSLAVSVVVSADDIDLFRVGLSGNEKERFLAEDAADPITLPDGTIGGIQVDKDPNAEFLRYVSVDPRTRKVKTIAMIEGDDVSVIACYP